MKYHKKLFKRLTAVGAFLFCLILLLTILLPQAVWADQVVKVEKNVLTPEIKRLDNGRIAFIWQTPEPTDGAVYYSVDDSFDQFSRHAGPFKEHVVVLENLLAATTYHYRVVSQSPSGEKYSSPHELIWSFHQQDLRVAKLEINQQIKLFGDKLLSPNQPLAYLTVANTGEIDLTDQWYISFLISPAVAETDDNLVSALTQNYYSCFVDLGVKEKIPAGATTEINLPTDLFSRCDVIPAGDYQLTLAVDYINQIAEADELNNVADIFFTVLPIEQAPSIEKIKTSEVTFDQIKVDFSSVNEIASSTPRLEYALFNGEQRKNFYLQDVMSADNGWTTWIKGLQAGSRYSYRIHFGQSNAVSDWYDVTTIADPDADLKRLMSLKRENYNCRIVEAKPLANSSWQDLGLTVPENHGVLRYRIQWSNGTWSPWYIPGEGDVDWNLNKQKAKRRVWSHFEDHVFQYETCSQLADLSAEKTIKIHEQPQVLGSEMTVKNASQQNIVVAKPTLKQQVWKLLQKNEIFQRYSLLEVENFFSAAAQRKQS